jgi:hypothetical protein
MGSFSIGIWAIIVVVLALVEAIACFNFLKIAGTKNKIKVYSMMLGVTLLSFGLINAKDLSVLWSGGIR